MVGREMPADNSDPVKALSNLLSEFYIDLEDLAEDGSVENLIAVLVTLRDLRTAIDVFDRFAVDILQHHDMSGSEIDLGLSGSSEATWQHPRWTEGELGAAENRSADSSSSRVSCDDRVLRRENVYTRSDLREIFGIRDATLNNGVYHFKERREIWLFVTENKQADREQFVDKLVGDVLYWQGQRLGRTDHLVIDHKQQGEKLLLFYRRAKYEFERAGFRCEGTFEYVDHSGSRPTSFVLRRARS